VNQTQSQSEVPTLFRVTLEVGDLEEAAVFYARLFSTPGQRHPGARQYFQCGSAIVAVIDPTQGGIAPSPGPKSLYFAVRDIDAVHQRALSSTLWLLTRSTVSPLPMSSGGPGASAPSTLWIRGVTTCVYG
jgi:predicted enzyme related to lactoylglutathione lyase